MASQRNRKSRTNQGEQGNLFDLPSQPETRTEPPTAMMDDRVRDELMINFFALASLEGIGSRTLVALFDAGVLTHIRELDSRQLDAQWPSGRYHVNFASKISGNKQAIIDEGEKAAHSLRQQGIQFVPLGHEDYPNALRRLPDPPRWIFVKGSIDAVQSESLIAVVGTREASSTGLRLAYHCARELVFRNIIVLSGLAKGIDQAAHSGATQHYGRSVAVLGHGIGSPFSSQQTEHWTEILETGGAIISEYLPADPPSRERFLRRNELQAALSRVVIPIECPSMVSGTGATIRRAIALQTSVVGITQDGESEPALLATRTNLEQLGFPVFTLSRSNSADFWQYLMSKLPNHIWTVDPKKRQDALFRIVSNQLIKAKERVSLDKEAIDRLAEQVKQRLVESDAQPLAGGDT